LVAVETKSWVDQKGRKLSKAGFAKIMVPHENKKEAQDFVDQAIEKNSMVRRKPKFHPFKKCGVDYQVVDSDQEILDNWLPWVHKFISNAKSWIVGTHHVVEAKYLSQYLAEYTFRFNRRHDPDFLFFRAVAACVHAKPTTSQALFG
jgi:hypothetical protein